MAARWSVLIATVCLAAVACSPAAPGPSTSGVPTAGVPTAAPASLPGPASATPGAQTAAPPSPSATDTPQPLPTAAGSDTTTFHLVLADGPKAGTWDVSSSGEVPACKYLPDLDVWTATYLGLPPLTFIDARGADADPYFLLAFDGEASDAVRFRPIGEITFDVEDRGDSATLTLVSAENEADFDDGSPSVDTGEAALTIECGSVFRYT